MADNRLIERLVEQQLTKRLARLEEQLAVQHCLLTELVRQMPRHAVLDTARRLHALRMQSKAHTGGTMDPSEQWWLYLCQTGGLTEKECPTTAGTYQFQ